MSFIYKVEINYRAYTFANGTTALAFAEMAKAHQEDDNEVTIEIVEDKDE